ncbi:MAG: arginine--tRNA ligase [Chloroflexi bacterium]|nr:arginine--tRNA ligase [Chloroflexota bacterium]MBU1747736.1 arginine--tRNA ligase [Chloroflexota bacterium]
MIRDDIATLFRQALEAAWAAGDLPHFAVSDLAVEHPRQADHGDYATTLALKYQKDAAMKPRALAEVIVRHLPPAPFVGRVEIAGPGFINIALADAWLARQVETIRAAGDAWGAIDLGHGLQTQVEFVSSNPTGPLTVGHGRGAAIGDTLAHLLTAAGYDVTREYYFNNAGRQMTVLGDSVRLRYRELLGQPIDFPADYYQGGYIIDIAQVVLDEHGDSLADTADITIFKDTAERLIFAEIQVTLARLGVVFDVYYNEDDLYKTGKVQTTLEALRERGHVYDKDGAVWFRTTDLGGDEDRVVVKGTGEPTYRLPDIAYHVDKLERGFGYIIDVLGADHIAAFPDVMRGLQALGYPTDGIRLVLNQFITVLRDGQVVKMSTRRANFVTLDELIDEAGPDAVRYFMLARATESHMEFDLSLAVEQSERNPVYYVQYAHARIASILRKAPDIDWRTGDVSLLAHPSELALIRQLLRLPEVVEKAALELAPHYVPYYAQELATTFHLFYRDCRVLSDDEALTKARLKLAATAQIVLARALNLMGLSAPDSM